MIGERTSAGWEVRFRSQGPARFLGAGFLGLWLCGWTAGEGFALWMLYKGAMALLRGELPSSGGAPLAVGAALGMGLFLLVWLSFWTLGGVLAMREMLRLLWSEDLLTAHGGGLTVRHTIGPFHSTVEIARDTIREISLLPRGFRLVVRTDRGNVELSQLGSRPQREEASTVLRAELGVADSNGAEGSKLPKEWDEVITPEGERVVTPAVGTRRAQARTAAIVAMVFGSLALMMVREAMIHVGMVPGAVFLLVVTAGLTWGAAWLGRGRMEWRIGSGHLTLRRRFGASVRDVFEARRLELSTASDSDGDDWYHLDALESVDPAPRPRGATPVAFSRQGIQWGVKGRRRIASAMNDPTVPRQLGAWLARTSSLALDDRATPTARVIELAELRGRLENAGTLGRMASRLIGNLVSQQLGKKP